ncbi:hypothetical protein PIB30_045567 [Stylosanthes scabra]|uniref:PB1-like domain-containing protein n=1 Tax=Stylosanthes scabra TaxID=79078 RepID=A0ABU6XEL5_9FABA|nr:hypothetical protein [Stylosanthes scabra]
MRYVGGEELIIEENDSDFWCVFEAEEQLVRLGHEKSEIVALWFKDPAIADLSVGLRIFLDDKDALEMVRIAAQRGHVELFVVHHDGHEEGFPEIGYIDVGGDPPKGNGGDGQNEGGGDEVPEPEVANDEGAAAEGDAAATIDEGEVAASDVVAPLSEAGSGPGEAKSILEGDQNAKGLCADEEGVVGEEDGGLEEHGDVNEGDTDAGIRTEDSDSDDAEYVPSADEVDSADDVHFNDSEEEFDLDESFFGFQTESAQNASNGKRKSVVNEDFSDAGEDNDELEDGHAVGGYDREGGEEEDGEGDRVVFLVHKAQQNMAEYKWQVETVYSSREEFKDAVTSNVVYTKRGIKFEKVDP